MTGGDDTRGIDAAVAATRGRIRVAVVDDHPVVREGTAALLAAQRGFEVVGTAGDLAGARELIARGDADVVLLDIRLGEATGLALLHEGAGSGLAIVVVTAYDYPQYVQNALDNGAAGFVLKTAPLADLVEAIHRAADGGRAFASGPRPGPVARPSVRELEVVRLVADGRSNDEIAGALGIATKTVETHMSRLFDRFGIASRTELATRAIREGWLELP